MQIIEYEKDSFFECRFRQHHFELDRNTDDDYSYANWYMLVKTDSGEIVCDGWLDDSSHYTVKQAMNYACEGAEIEPPKRWPNLDS